jgi:hypothetical protein
MATELTIEDVKAFIRGKSSTPILHVRDTKDPDFISMHKLVCEIWPDTGDNIYEVSRRMNSLMGNLRHMESRDYNSIIDTFKKYEVKGIGGGIRGKKTYGYDRSRIDGAMIRRKRGN